MFAVQSNYDECFFIWHNALTDEVDAMASAHVDDNGVMATPSWLQWAYEEFKKKFGDVTRQKLPLRHCGIDHEKIDTPYDKKNGFSMRLHQQEFTKKLKPAQTGDAKVAGRTLFGIS